MYACQKFPDFECYYFRIFATLNRTIVQLNRTKITIRKWRYSYSLIFTFLFIKTDIDIQNCFFISFLSLFCRQQLKCVLVLSLAETIFCNARNIFLEPAVASHKQNQFIFVFPSECIFKEMFLNNNNDNNNAYQIKWTYAVLNMAASQSREQF